MLCLLNSCFIKIVPFFTNVHSFPVSSNSFSAAWATVEQLQSIWMKFVSKYKGEWLWIQLLQPLWKLRSKPFVGLPSQTCLGTVQLRVSEDTERLRKSLKGLKKMKVKNLYFHSSRDKWHGAYRKPLLELTGVRIHGHLLTWTRLSLMTFGSEAQ